MTARRLSAEELARFRAAMCDLPGCDCSRAKFGALTGHIEALEAELACPGCAASCVEVCAKHAWAAQRLRAVEAERDRLRAEVERLREAAAFVVDYARDLGQCAVCDGAIVQTEGTCPECECNAECPGRLLRAAFGGRSSASPAGKGEKP